jgi:hypothetical protein
MGIKSLEKICDNQAFQAELQAFFFSSDPELLHSLKISLSHSSLEVAVMQLFSKIQKLKLNHRFLDEETEKQILNKLFCGDAKMVLAVVDFVELWGTSCWVAAVDTFCKFQVRFPGIFLPNPSKLKIR